MYGEDNEKTRQKLSAALFSVGYQNTCHQLGADNHTKERKLWARCKWRNAENRNSWFPTGCIAWKLFSWIWWVFWRDLFFGKVDCHALFCCTSRCEELQKTARQDVGVPEAVPARDVRVPDEATSPGGGTRPARARGSSNLGGGNHGQQIVMQCPRLFTNQKLTCETNEDQTQIQCYVTRTSVCEWAHRDGWFLQLRWEEHQSVDRWRAADRSGLEESEPVVVAAPSGAEWRFQLWSKALHHREGRSTCLRVFLRVNMCAQNLPGK